MFRLIQVEVDIGAQERGWGDRESKLKDKRDDLGTFGVQGK